jgi:hypothetical protein
MWANRALKRDWDQLSRRIDESKLDEDKKSFLWARWLDPILTFERKAKNNERLHLGLRTIAVVGGILVPALVSVKGHWAHPTSIVTGLVVAIAIALDGLLDLSGRWREYAQTAEGLKTLGWQFFELAGQYKEQTSLEEAFKPFVADVEDLIKAEVSVYLNQFTVAAGGAGAGDGGGGGGGGKGGA